MWSGKSVGSCRGQIHQALLAVSLWLKQFPIQGLHFHRSKMRILIFPQQACHLIEMAGRPSNRDGTRNLAQRLSQREHVLNVSSFPGARFWVKLFNSKPLRISETQGKACNAIEGPRALGRLGACGPLSLLLLHCGYLADKATSVTLPSYPLYSSLYSAFSTSALWTLSVLEHWLHCFSYIFRCMCLNSLTRV